MIWVLWQLVKIKGPGHSDINEKKIFGLDLRI